MYADERYCRIQEPLVSKYWSVGPRWIVTGARWPYSKGVTLDFSRPGKPTDNAYIEAFDSRFRAECLNAPWFLTLADAVEKLDGWRRYYNEVRPHGAIGHKVPILLLNPDGATSPPS